MNIAERIKLRRYYLRRGMKIDLIGTYFVYTKVYNYIFQG